MASKAASKAGSSKAGSSKAGSAKVKWKQDPEEHDFPAAADYLSLVASDDRVAALVTGLRDATTVHRKAKDILRAARLPLLAVDNPHVASDLAKIRGRVALSPVLLVRGDLDGAAPLEVADGYHRVCASYHTAEDTDIPCRIAARS